MHLTRKLFALKTTLNVPVLNAFPENTAPLAFSRFSQQPISPFTPKTSILLSLKAAQKPQLQVSSFIYKKREKQ